MTDKIPSRWMAAVVFYGEKKKHLYVGVDAGPHMFATEAEADKWAKEFCADDRTAMVSVLKVERIIKAAPATFEVEHS